MMRPFELIARALGLALVAAACGGGPNTTDGGTGSTGGAAGTTADTTPGTTAEPATSTSTSTSESGSGGQTGSTTAETGSGTTVEPATTGGPSTTGEPGTTGTGGSTGGGLCDEFVQPGCIHNGCPEGQVCDTQVGCVPSSCGCDPQTGDVICTADCGGGTCVEPGRCEPIVCELECKFGLKKDMFGCEICECDEEPDCGCESDADCVKASPGCCSCNMGGTEVAVAAACLDQLEKCPVPPEEVFCPAVYKCTDAQAVCVQGACVLQ